MTTTLKDIEEEGESNCCGAKVYFDVCSDCKEHCGIINEEDDNSPWTDRYEYGDDGLPSE